jgi:UDP-glucose 4-epimerase
VESSGRCLVTGGCGFIGSNLVKKLSSSRWKVDVVDDLSSGDISLLGNIPLKIYRKVGPFGWDDETPPSSHEVNCFISSFDDPLIASRLKQKQYDVVFHQAAIPRVSYSVERPSLTTEVNVLGSVRLLEACRGNVRRVIMASSSSVYGGKGKLPTKESTTRRPQSPYALQKSSVEDFAEMFTKLYGMDVISLRYFNVYGPGQLAGSPYSTAVSAWCHAIKNGLPLRSDGDGTQSRDMCYVDNVVQANIKAAGAPEPDKRRRHRVYNVACGSSVTNRAILDFLSVRYPHITVTDAPWREGDVMHSLADISLAKTELGYSPTVLFWEGLRRTLEWWGI